MRVGEVGMVQQADQEVRGAVPAGDALLEHGGEHPRRVPHVDELDGVTAPHRQQQRGEHADPVPDRRAGGTWQSW